MLNTLVLAFFPKEDYFVTPDQIWVPLRWIAPELIDEVHGNLLVVDQTKTSNVWWDTPALIVNVILLDNIGVCSSAQI